MNGNPLSSNPPIKTKGIFSFEVFPPKKDQGITTLASAFAELAALSPDYISVTLGAGGNTSLRQNTLKVADQLQNTHGVPAVAHLPAINFNRNTVSHFLDTLEQHDIRRVLALRADSSPNTPKNTDFQYAADLISFIRQRGGFYIGAACYPETHLEATSPADDLYYLKQKVDTGVDYLITQLFFDNQRFFDFMEQVQRLGIHIPIQAGIMPITNAQQIKHITELTQVHIPKPLATLLQRYADDLPSLRAAGLDYATTQIDELVAHDVTGFAGVHLYTMNDPAVATHVYRQCHHLFHSAQKIA